MKRISEHLFKQLVKTGYFIGRRFVIHKKTYTSHFCNEKKMKNTVQLAHVDWIQDA